MSQKYVNQTSKEVIQKYVNQFSLSESQKQQMWQNIHRRQVRKLRRPVKRC